MRKNIYFLFIFRKLNHSNKMTTEELETSTMETSTIEDSTDYEGINFHYFLILNFFKFRYSNF